MENLIDRLEKLKKSLPKAKTDVMLKDLTTIHTGGRAELFFEAKTSQELIFAVEEAARLNVPYFILGGGSNIVFSEAGFPGLLIKNNTSNLLFLPDTNEVIVDSGVLVVRLVNEAAMRDLGGMEYFASLPGTVGGALYGNSECFGHTLSEFAEKITVFFFEPNFKKPQLLSVTPEWFEYEYRGSKLKRLAGFNKPVILSVKFRLRHRKKEDILKDLKEYREKREKLYQPIGQFSAGCFFKNPGGSSHKKPPLAKEETAGYLIEKAGLKGKRIGGAMVSKAHANFIINYKNATSNDIWRLKEEVKRKVKESFNIELKEEVEFIGPFWEEEKI